MLKKVQGSIVNMSSAASSVKGRGAALRLRYDQGCRDRPHQVRCRGLRCARAYAANAICPGTVQTPSLDERIAGLGGRDRRPSILPPAPTHGAVRPRPREIAALAVYLASDESAFMTGTVNVIDGGWSV